MEDRDGFIWLDGRLVPWRDATVHVLSHTLQHGTGVFEGTRCYDGVDGPAIFRLSDHCRRLIRSAHILGLPLAVSLDELESAHIEVLRANGLRDAYLRTTVHLGGEQVGVSARGLSIHLSIASWAWAHYHGEEARRRGLRLKTSSYVRHHQNAMMLKAKACGGYLNAVLAQQEAVRCGCDDALMLDASGMVAEATTSNLFIMRDGVLLTPPPAAILEGITRDTVMELAREVNMPLVERPIARDEVYIADEAFVTGTAAEIVPVVELDGRCIGSGRPGPATQQICARFEAAVRTEPDVRGWRTCVEAAGR